MAKALDAFRTISEVADDLAVPKHVLRFWEAKFNQIRPMKRGGGRRYYRPEDLELLRGIRHLLHREGYTIKGVQKILREQGSDAVKRFGRTEAPKGHAGPPNAPEATPSGSRLKSRSPAMPPQKSASARGAAIGSGSVTRTTAAKSQDVLAVVRAAIGTLEDCRAILQGAQPPQSAPKARTARRQR
jgi:DNA-binding transcriptional MerR regulator